MEAYHAFGSSLIPHMSPETLFRSNLALIDRVIDGVCRRARLRDADAEDFASTVRLTLIENDYAILRRWEGRSSLATYLAVVARRILADQRVRDYGRWHASAEARRAGEAGILLETLLLRDGRSLEESIPIVQSCDASLTREAIVELAQRFPEHARRARATSLEDAITDVMASNDKANAALEESEAHALSTRVGRVIRHTVAQWSDEDQTILRLRFGIAMNISDIAKMLRIPQRPLYRRIEHLLDRLRRACVAEGVSGADLQGLIGNATLDWNLGLESRKSEAVCPSNQTSGDARAAEEVR